LTIVFVLLTNDVGLLCICKKKLSNHRINQDNIRAFAVKINEIVKEYCTAEYTTEGRWFTVNINGNIT